MKICFISDTHGQFQHLPELPEADVLVHAGDLTLGDPAPQSRLAELREATDWLRKQRKRFSRVIAIAGNHDWACEAFYKTKHEDILRSDFFYDIDYLRDSSIIIDGVKFYGSPWTPAFFNWAFNQMRGAQSAERWAAIPDDTDVLVTHGPPMGILDRVGPDSVGCADLRFRVEKVAPKIHAFGHIHCAYGEKKFGPTKYVNAALLNEIYKPKNAPIVVEI